MNNQPHVIVVAGPTAVGKTSVAIQLARHFKTEILSFDSRQCYQELNIGVARPTTAELNAAKHHFIASNSINTPVDAASFEQYGLQVLQEIFTKSPIAIAVGGTGLYLRALLTGIDEMPEIPEEIRTQIRLNYLELGLPWLHETLAKADPLYASTGEMSNPHRMLRALEVWQTTGESIKKWQKQAKPKRPFKVIKLGMDLPKEALHQRINQRTKDMMQDGLVEEVNGLESYKSHQALQTVGYKEIFDYLSKQITKDQAVSLIQTHTRQYAKRQLTWFRKDPEYLWLSPKKIAPIIDAIQSKLVS